MKFTRDANEIIHRLHIDFSDAQGQVTPQALVESD